MSNVAHIWRLKDNLQKYLPTSTNTEIRMGKISNERIEITKATNSYYVYIGNKM